MLAPASARFPLARFPLAAALALLLLGSAAACAGGGQSFRLFSRSRPSPDAILRVNASFDAASGTTRLRLRASKLAEPGWVRPGAKSWRVWVRANEAQPWQLLGQLDSGLSFGPANVPGRTFELWVTAEIAPRPLGPTYAPTFARKLTLP